MHGFAARETSHRHLEHQFAAAAAPLLKELIAALEPDVICLQETKVPDELFPAEAPAQLGFPHVLFRGMKGYNGVAILSRLPILLHDIAPDWCCEGRLPAHRRAARHQGRTGGTA